MAESIEIIKTDKSGCKCMKYAGIDFWVNRYNKIMFAYDWNVVDQLVAAGLAVRINHHGLLNHTDYIIK